MEAEAQARKELEAIMGDSNQSENARRRAKEALRKQADEMAALQAQMDAESKEKESLEAKLAAMESKLLQGGVNLLDKVKGSYSASTSLTGISWMVSHHLKLVTVTCRKPAEALEQAKHSHAEKLA
ncbi:hypothetical protein DUNSADRAFT_5914 [Dunaliella salina]|uniref:Uncharacterized protein n=1 Tax=Dunaliella salina TaxID=3046 RepID=A0ABQ7GPD9_DUNSA|nr:hypothetical protein DUNSADRAFT_5914 [Dunaliella salina]|eukprot:KAF5836467.1 hypothetical protein DUNSADRAFT_5914 [Dunaliella salina]